MSVRDAERLYARARSSLEDQSDQLQRLFESLHPQYAQQYALIEREYLRFIVLKVLHKDTSVPTQMSPSTTVDLLWHTHVLVSVTAVLCAHMLQAQEVC